MQSSFMCQDHFGSATEKLTLDFNMWETSIALLN